MKYEYKVIAFDVKGFLGGKVDANAIQAHLNQLGAEGWQLKRVSEILRDAGVTTKLVLFMERPAGQT